MTGSIDAYLVQEQSRQISPDWIWNDGALGFFYRQLPQQEEHKNKMSSDIGSVPGTKILQAGQKVSMSTVRQKISINQVMYAAGLQSMEVIPQLPPKNCSLLPPPKKRRNSTVPPNKNIFGWLCACLCQLSLLYVCWRMHSVNAPSAVGPRMEHCRGIIAGTNNSLVRLLNK